MAPDDARSPYYVANFDRILATVLSRYGDLLRPDERAFADEIRSLQLGARCLYVRLVSRQGPYFRRDTLRYPEIADLDVAIVELEDRGFLAVDPPAEPAELLRHLLRHEVEALALELAAAGPPRSAARLTKGQAIAALVGGYDAPDLLRALRARATLLAPTRLEQVALYRLLFFGNLRQEWSELVLTDLGVFRYESYALLQSLRLYPTRAAIDDAVGARALAAQARQLLEARDLPAAAALAADVARRSPQWDASARGVIDAILLEVARPLERAGAAAEAMELYAAATTPPARERLARLMARVGRERRALALCREIAASPRDESERLFARDFDRRLRRAIGQLPPARRRYRSARHLRLRREGDRPVEELALAHFAREGRVGFHSENWLWLSLYGLAFWDVVFAPVAGAFQHAFQDAPLDLAEPAFRARREAAVTSRLAEIAAGAWPSSRLLGVWHAKHGIRNRLVSWWPEAPGLLELALSRLRGAQLAAVLDRLSRDLGRYGRGLPDLFVLGPAADAFELLEVKSPSDRLRPEQVGWLDHLAEHGLPCAVLAVAWEAAQRAPAHALAAGVVESSR